MLNQPIETCIFCDNISNSREHLFPKWLLEYYKLYDQKLSLLDGSLISYRYLVIPLCNKCNNETLSKIENSIRNGNASDIEYYLWVIKISIGILYKESSLVSYKDPERKTILIKERLATTLHMAKSMISVYKHGGSLYPSPPGSVILIPKKDNVYFFDFSDIPIVPITGITLPNKYLIVLPFDHGRTKSVTNVNVIKQPMDSLLFKFLIADMGYDAFRWEEGVTSITFENQIFSALGSYKKYQSRAFKDSEFIQFLYAVGINGKKQGEKWRLEPLNKNG